MSTRVLTQRGISTDSDRPIFPVSPVLWVSEFEPENAEQFFFEFTGLLSNDEVKEILIYIDSFGGAVDSLSMMIELIEASPKPVTTICVGKAFSAGALMTSLGHEDMRWIAPNSRMMFHRLQITFASGEPEQMNTIAKELIRMNEVWMKKAVDRSKLTWKEFNAILDKKGGEWYLSARQAKKYGFVDHIGLPIVQETHQVKAEINEKRKNKTSKKPKAKTRRKTR